MVMVGIDSVEHCSTRDGGCVWVVVKDKVNEVTGDGSRVMVVMATNDLDALGRMMMTVLMRWRWLCAQCS